MKNVLDILRAGIDETLLGLGRDSVADLVAADVVMAPGFTRSARGSRRDDVPDDSIDPTAPPSGTGCVECLASDGWWLHLRRCAKCGHIGCCDSSPSQHATAHWRSTGHSVMHSFEPGEEWFWDFVAEEIRDGPALATPRHHPLDQPVPGPAGRVPRDWQRRLH